MANEMRLIDANTLKAEFTGNFHETWHYTGIRATIDVAPTVDAVPVVHAEWVVCGDGDNVPWMCSHCGKTTAHKYKTMYGKYCPNCGAKMDGGNEDG